MKAADTLVTLAVQFALMSLFAFGGANAVIPEMHRQAVDLHHWMTGSEFAALFAIFQAAPGPNFMIATLVGWKAAGLPGAMIATVALCAPSCFFTYWVVKVWDRSREARWRGGDPGRDRAGYRRLGDRDRLSSDPGRGPQLAVGPGDRGGGAGRLPLPAQSPLAVGRRYCSGADGPADLRFRREARVSTT